MKRYYIEKEPFTSNRQLFTKTIYSKQMPGEKFTKKIMYFPTEIFHSNFENERLKSGVLNIKQSIFVLSSTGITVGEIKNQTSSLNRIRLNVTALENQ